MTTGRYSRFTAVLTLAAGGVLFTAVAAITAIAAISAIAPVPAVAQDAPPAGDSPDNIAERLRQRGIDVSPEQIERAQQVMQDIRDGIPPDPNQLRLVFGDIRKQVEKQRQKQLQEELGATDEEWKALGPKIEKVRTLSRLVGDDGGPGAPGGMPGGMFGGGPGGMPGGPGGPMFMRNADPNAAPRGPMFMRNLDPNAQPSDIEKKSQALQTLLDNKQAKPEAVADALTAYRDARVKTRQDLAKARQELKDLLTVRQEAQLVTMGILE